MKIKALRDVQDARRMVDYWSSEGVTSYKAYMHIRRNELAQIIALAHQRGQKVTAHLCSVTYGEAAEAGIDNLEHGFFVASDFVSDKRPDQCPSGAAVQESLASLDIDGPEANALIRLLVERGVAITSTLTIFETLVKGRPRAYPGALDMLIPQLREQYESNWHRIAEAEDSDTARVFEKAMQLEKRFVEAGGTLLVGTDPTGYGGVVAGFGSKRAIELLVEAGFSIEQAVMFSTLKAAKFLNLATNLGSIETGKRADLVIIDGDLATDTSSIRNMQWVFKNGIGYDTKMIFDATRGTVGLH